MKIKGGSFVVIFRDDRRDEVFLVFRSDTSIWNLPGGGIEDTESSEEAALREVFEETGYKIKLLHLLGTYNNIDFKTGGIWNKAFLYEGSIISGEFKPEFLGCKGQWFPLSKLPSEIKPVTTTRIKDARSYSGKPFVKDFKPINA